MTRVRIPATIGEAVDRLGGIDALLTATEWERAAIVAAFVDISPSQAHLKSEMMSPTTFAEMGIVGLRSPNTVARYVKAWLAVNDGKRPKPGFTAALPTSTFPPEDANLGSRITESSIGRAIRSKPEIAAAAAEALADDTVELPPKAAASLAHGSRQRVTRMTDSARGDRRKPTEAETLDAQWSVWLSAIDRLLAEGADLSVRTERAHVSLGVHAAMAKMIYERITERKIDAELRDFFAREGVR